MRVSIRDRLRGELERNDLLTVLAMLACGFVLSYWFVYALVVPVTTYDSHVYNMARLLLVERDGLFGNRLWNDTRQVSFPWSFDAVHYPLLKLGWGVALPSFSCFVGLLFIIFRISRRAINAAAGWWCCLALLALPLLVFQATATKNDVAVLFGGACWYYAFWLWKREKRVLYVTFMAISLSFMAGAKTSGLPLLGVLGCYTVWTLRRFPGEWKIFLSTGVLSFALLGSVETYANNWIAYANPLGDADFVNYHRNLDGFKGAVANFIRYIFGSISVPVEIWPKDSAFISWLEDVCRSVLQTFGLIDAGHRPGYSDEHLRFLKTGREASSDFGVLGTIALLSSCLILVSQNWKKPAWRLTLAGFLSMSLTCYFVCWMPWNNRFLLIPFVLFTLALTLTVLGFSRCVFGVRFVYLGLLFFGALVYPLYSFNKSPFDLMRSITEREEIFFKERIVTKEVRDHVVRSMRERGAEMLFLRAGSDAWVLPFLLLDDIEVEPVPELSPEVFDAYVRNNPGERLFFLTLNRRINERHYPGLYKYKSYRDPSSQLYVTGIDELRLLDFSRDELPALSGGWFEVEEDGRWSGATAEVRLPLPEGKSQTVKFDAKAVEKMKVLVRLNGNLVTTIEIPGRGYRLYEVEIPGEFVEGEDTLRLELQDRPSPDDSGMSTGSREIGIFVRYLYWEDS